MGLGILQGQKPHFYIGGRHRKRVMIFWFALIFLICFSVTQFLHLGQDIFTRKDPKVTAKKDFIKQPSFSELGPNTFNFRYSIVDFLDSTPFKNDSLVQINLFQGKIGTNHHYTLYPLETTNCTKEIYGETYYESDNFKCINPIQPNGLKVEYGGRIESGENKYADIAIVVTRCQNTTGSSVVCAPPEEIDRQLKIKTLGINVEYFKQEFDPFNYHKPTKVNPKIFYQPLSSKVSIETYFWMNDNTVISDSGVLTKDLSEFSYPTVSQVERTVADHQNVLFYGFFQANGDQTTYTRTYIKLPDILAQVEGVLSIIVICLIFLLLPYSSIKYYEDMINNLYDYNKLNGKLTFRAPKPANKKAEQLKEVKSPNEVLHTQEQHLLQTDNSPRQDSQQTEGNEILRNDDIILTGQNRYEGGPKENNSDSKYCEKKKEDDEAISSIQLKEKEFVIDEINSSVQSENLSSVNRASTQYSSHKLSIIKASQFQKNSESIKINLDQNEQPDQPNEQPDQPNEQPYQPNVQPDQPYKNHVNQHLQLAVNLTSINNNNDSKVYETILHKNSNYEESNTIPNQKPPQDQKKSKKCLCFRGKKGKKYEEEDEDEEEKEPEREKFINISFWGYMKYLMCCCRRNDQFKLLRYGAKKLKRDLDIVKLVCRMKEVQPMKNSLLADMYKLNANMLKYEREPTVFADRFIHQFSPSIRSELEKTQANH